MPRSPARKTTLAKAGGRFLVIGDPAYPPALAALADAPPVLSAIGDLDLLARPIAGGRRRARGLGRRPAAWPASWRRDWARPGFVIASGLARGIDAAAHEAALATGTVAVLAGGIDQVYPPQNAGLHRAIAGRGPAAERIAVGHAAGRPRLSPPQPHRQRPVAGVVVIEAAARSGSLITAHRAAEQGRDVFVVPGSPMDPRYAGSNSLIRDGAILTRDANDILGVLGRATVRPAKSLVQTKGKTGTTRRPPRSSSALGSVPTLVDELVRRCQVSAAAVAEVLLALELEGRLERHRGNRVSLI